MTSWYTVHTDDGKEYYVPQCEACGKRYDEYGAYARKETAVSDALNDGWQIWPALCSVHDWGCRCPAHWAVRCTMCDRHVEQVPRTSLADWIVDYGDDRGVNVCDQCLRRVDTMPALELGAWPVFHPSHQRRDKWQALKVLEEAAEVVEAAKQTIANDAANRGPLIREIADLLQTVTNLCAAFGINTAELERANTECTIKNMKRGMFDEGLRTHMHREKEQ